MTRKRSRVMELGLMQICCIYGFIVCLNVVNAFTPLYIPPRLPVVMDQPKQNSFIRNQKLMAPLVHVMEISTITTTTRLYQQQSTNTIVTEVEEYLAERYPMFTNMILRKNENLWKKLLQNAVSENGGFTIFVLTDRYLTQNVITSEKIMNQLQDQRNLETIEKISLYHTINEIVSYEQLCYAGGIQTMGGVVPIEEKGNGNGFFGLFGNNKKRTNLQDDEVDAPITINGANIIRYYIIGNECSVFEMDNFLSPKLLWRFMDQLRIPGSK